MRTQAQRDEIPRKYRSCYSSACLHIRPYGKAKLLEFEDLSGIIFCPLSINKRAWIFCLIMQLGLTASIELGRLKLLSLQPTNYSEYD